MPASQTGQRVLYQTVSWPGETSMLLVAVIEASCAAVLCRQNRLVHIRTELFRGHAILPFEGARESGGTVIARSIGSLLDRHAFTDRLCCKAEAPAREVGHRRLANQQRK